MKKWMAALVLVLLFAGFAWAGNNCLETTEYTLTLKGLPEAFDGTRIVQVADLHNATFGREQSALAEQVEAAEPDAIFLTGDLIDSNRYDLDAALLAVDRLVEMADVYFITGNHEISSNDVDEITAALEERGVTVLRDEAVSWEKDGEQVRVAGIDDPLIDSDHDPEEVAAESLSRIPQTGDFTLLLAHRPELIQAYAESGAEVVFSGHAHGGQIRIPGIGGLFAPGQGMFPSMTEGLFRRQDTVLVLSRGLGNSGFPVRIFNRPEVVAVTLERAAERPAQ